MGNRTEALGPAAIYAEWQKALTANDTEAAAKVVDLENYTEICLGLTQWTTGYEMAAANFYKNMIAPWGDLKFTPQDLQESADGVTVRLRVEGTQVSEFLGIPPTGRRIRWDHVAIVKIKDGKVIGQWAQPDLWGIYKQLTTG